MTIDLDTVKWLLAVVISPAIIAVYLWLTQKYWPSRQQHADKTADSVRTFSEQSQGSALGQVLNTQKQLIDHLIASNNGHLSALTDEVRDGFVTQDDSIKEVVSSINKLLVLMSQQQVMYRGLRNSDDPMTATIRSSSDKKADKVVDDEMEAGDD